jgi:hypothetical protein
VSGALYTVPSNGSAFAKIQNPRLAIVPLPPTAPSPCLPGRPDDDTAQQDNAFHNGCARRREANANHLTLTSQARHGPGLRIDRQMAVSTSFLLPAKALHAALPCGRHPSSHGFLAGFSKVSLPFLTSWLSLAFGKRHDFMIYEETGRIRGKSAQTTAAKAIGGRF